MNRKEESRMPDLKDVIEDVRDHLDNAIVHENARPPNVSGSEQEAVGAIDGDVNLIIILTDPPNLKPFNAGQTVTAIYYDDRVQFLQALRDYANQAYNEAHGGNDQAVIGENLWKIWNSRVGLYSLYP